MYVHIYAYVCTYIDTYDMNACMCMYMAFPKENGVTFGGSVPRARAGCARCERSPPCARRRGGRLNDCGEGVRFQFERFGSKVTF